MRPRPPRSNWGTSSADWNSFEPVGRSLIILGLVIAAAGLLITWGAPLGRLPGDFHVRRGNFSFYFPLATSIIASIVLTLIMWMFRR